MYFKVMANVQFLVEADTEDEGKAKVLRNEAIGQPMVLSDMKAEVIPPRLAALYVGRLECLETKRERKGVDSG